MDLTTFSYSELQALIKDPIGYFKELKQEAYDDFIVKCTEANLSLGTDSDEANAYAHAYASAHIANILDPDLALALGYQKEIHTKDDEIYRFGSVENAAKDTNRDLWNNEKGIEYLETAKNEGRSFDSAADDIFNNIVSSNSDFISDYMNDTRRWNDNSSLESIWDQVEIAKNILPLSDILKLMTPTGLFDSLFGGAIRTLFGRGLRSFETTCSNQVIDYTERPDTSLTTVSEQGLIITPSIAEEPNILGSDALLGLQNAMAADTTGELQNLVDSYKNTVSNNQTLDFSNRTVTVDNIIKKWTGSDTIEAGSAGEYVDAQKLNAVEMFMGERFVNHNDILGEGAASYIESIYQQLHKMVDSQLMLQTNLKDISELITISYDSTTEKLTYDYSAVITAIESAITTDETTGKNLLSEFTYAMYGVGLDQESGFSTFYNTFAVLGEDYRNILDISRVYTGTTVDIINGTTGADSLTATASDSVIYGKDGNDTIIGGAGNNLIFGDAGNDSINAGAGDDTIYGGTGTNYADGGIGNDTYVFNQGDGTLTINDAGAYYSNSGSIAYAVSQDVLQLGEGITQANTILTRSGDNLVITFVGNTDSITIINQFQVDAITSAHQIEEIKFTDGTTLTLGDYELQTNMIAA